MRHLKIKLGYTSSTKTLHPYWENLDLSHLIEQKYLHTVVYLDNIWIVLPYNGATEFVDIINSIYLQQQFMYMYERKLKYNFQFFL